MNPTLHPVNIPYLTRLAQPPQSHIKTPNTQPQGLDPELSNEGRNLDPPTPKNRESESSLPDLATRPRLYELHFSKHSCGTAGFGLRGPRSLERFRVRENP